MRTPQDRHVLLCLVAAALVGPFAAVGGHRASAEPVAAQGDFAGLIDIGGRRIYLDCRGTDSPTVVLVADVGNHRLLAITVSPVALFLAGEMMVYLSIENPLGPGPSSNRRAVRLGQKPSSDQRQPAAVQGRRRVCEVLCVVASSGSFAPIMPNARNS